MPCLFALIGILAGPARADGIWDDCVRAGGTGDYYQYFNSGTVALGRDAAVGEVVGPWFTASKSPAWSCTRRSSYGGIAVTLAVQGYPPYLKLGALVYDGSTYAHYATTNPALGYVVRWRSTIDGTTTDWTPLTVGTGAQQTPVSTVAVTKTADATYSISVETQIRFVKRTNALTGGYSQTIVDPIYVRHMQTVDATTSHGSGTYRISQMPSGTVTFTSGGTCTTPDVAVDLGEAAVSDFAGVGSTTGTATSFDLAFNNCPAGLGGIQYYFSATNGLVDASNGVIGLDGSSTAAGVAIRLTTQAGAALTFGSANAYSLSAYDASSGGSYAVPLAASFYQTEAAVSAGSVDSSMTFTLIYK